MTTIAVWSAAILAWSFVANLGLGDRLYVPRNLLLAVAVVALARWQAVTWEELGLGREQAAAGVRWGAGAAVVVLVVVGAGALLGDAVPWLGTLLSDQRAAAAGPELLATTLWRIPVGTALFEEILFRGVLLALLLRALPVGQAVVWSSVVFGLWHIAPTIVTLRINEVAPTSSEGVVAVAAGVAVTLVGGFAFAWLRLRSGSIIAPVIAHWAINASALLAAVGYQRLT